MRPQRYERPAMTGFQFLGRQARHTPYATGDRMPPMRRRDRSAYEVYRLVHDAGTNIEHLRRRQTAISGHGKWPCGSPVMRIQRV
jgi:hypothetical protein